MATTGKAELGPSHNTGKPGPVLLPGIRASFLFSPATTPLAFPYLGPPKHLPTSPLWGPQTQPTDAEGISTHPKPVFLLCSVSATPCPQAPHSPSHQQPQPTSGSTSHTPTPSSSPPASPHSWQRPSLTMSLYSKTSHGSPVPEDEVRAPQHVSQGLP